MKIHKISSKHLSIDDVKRIISEDYKLVLSPEAQKKITDCRRYLNNKMETQKEPVYGVTTGFGSLCNVSVSKDDLSQLQKNLVMSHACGTGEKVPEKIVKIILLLKIQSLSYGFSGVQLATVERLIYFFNENVLPVVYQQGSLGASGDLAPLAHLALPLLGLGEVYFEGKIMPASEVLRAKNIQPITLQSKEGLALLNGTQFMSGYGVFACICADKISDAADTIGSLSLDAFDGRIEPFNIEVHKIRPHRGQLKTAERISALLADSQIVVQEKTHVQDPYSFRCMPQIHGASKDAIEYVKDVITTEINSATDNPTVVPQQDLIISAGNFHGQPLALAMDFLAIALAELGSVSGQRTYQLISGKRSLPPFLVKNSGLNSGFMIPQYTAASIVSQSKQLCTPASVDSIESSQGQEDHVSMGANAATKLFRVVENTFRVLAIELFNAAQALDFRRPLQSSAALENFYSQYRKKVQFIDNDEVMYPLIDRSTEFVKEFF
ncbi:MAG: histidine ammonia-lyase [Prevotellaceae bacterium]|nr:histidine ammonia-lyase [Prevotellaceae bacterium]